MIRTYRIWFLLALIAALVPAGTRLLLWERTTTAPLDPDMAQAGEVLFMHDWQANDPLCAEGDGPGPVFNATSCVACHKQVRPGGGGGLENNVTTFTVHVAGQPSRQGVVHANSLVQRETLQDIDPFLPPIAQPTLEQLKAIAPLQHGVHVSQRNTPALFGVKLIDEIPERDILAGAKRQRVRAGLTKGDEESLPLGRPSRLANGRIGRFGWKGQMASLSDFVQAACANELGLGNPGQAQPKPIYNASYIPPRGYDLTLEQCSQLTAFCASLPPPVERLPADMTGDQASAGKKIFNQIGCADCHTPKLGTVDGLYSDLLLHNMGAELVGGGSYGDPPVTLPDAPDDGPSPSEWRTPPLWGVADSAPYLHDGRAATLTDAIQMHGGQGKRAVLNFQKLPPREQLQLLGFLRTLQAP